MTLMPYISWEHTAVMQMISADTALFYVAQTRSVILRELTNLLVWQDLGSEPQSVGAVFPRPSGSDTPLS